MRRVVRLGHLHVELRGYHRGLHDLVVVPLGVDCVVAGRKCADDRRGAVDAWELAAVFA